jgi:hypothetical protein
VSRVNYGTVLGFFMYVLCARCMTWRHSGRGQSDIGLYAFCFVLFCRSALKVVKIN